MLVRELTFNSLDEVLADVQAVSGKDFSASGNWTPAENIDHVSKAIGFTVHGFPEGKPPLWQKIVFTTVFKLMAGKLLRTRLKPGLKFPGGLAYFAPEPGVAWDEAVRRLEQNIADAKTHRMTHPSPVVGHLSHEQWTLLHCRHAELHLGMIQPASTDAPAPTPADAPPHTP